MEVKRSCVKDRPKRDVAALIPIAHSKFANDNNPLSTRRLFPIARNVPQGPYDRC